MRVAAARINVAAEIHGAIHGDLILSGEIERGGGGERNERNYPGPVNTGIGRTRAIVIRLERPSRVDCKGVVAVTSIQPCP